MKAGTFRAGQAKAAAECFQVADHTGLTAYTSGEIGPQTVAIAELVTTHDKHWINGYDLGQQPDGRKWRHASRTPFASSASVRIISTPLAKYGDKVAEIPNGDWLYQERSADLIPDYRTLLVSVYARKMSASNGTLALDWAIDDDTLTVTAATVDTITDSSKSWGANEHQNSYILIRSGDGRYQHRLIASNSATVLALDSDLGLIPSEGDALDIVDWASPTMRRIDELTGAVVSSGTVRAYADWERFYVVFRPTATFNRLYVRIRSASGTIWVDGTKLEKASKLESGISTASSATTLTDSNRGWVDDAHLTRQVIILDGNDAGDCQTITDNDQTSITAAFAATPSTVSTYIIIPSNANIRPTPFIDLGQISASFYEASMYDLYTGTLLVGGGLSDAPRVIVEDRFGKVILKAGDFGDFKGWKFLNGAGAAFMGGSIIMRADQGYEDADERIKMSYRGIEGWVSDDVRKWGLFTQGAGFEFVMAKSPLQARIVINDSDGIAAYTAEGRKWWGVRPQVDPEEDEDINFWWLGFEEGNWASFTKDDGLQVKLLNIADGGEFRFGTGDPGVDFTGLRMYRDGSTYRLEGQSAGVVQAYFDSDGTLKWGGGKGKADDTGLEHVEDANNYWDVKPGTTYFMRVVTAGGPAFYAIYAKEDDGTAIFGECANGIGVRGYSVTEIGVAGYSVEHLGVSGRTVDGVGVYARASGDGDAIYGQARAAGIAMHADMYTTVTDAVIHGLRITHSIISPPVAAVGLGTGIEFELEDDGGDLDIAGALTVEWSSVTAGAEESKLHFWTTDVGDDGLVRRMTIDKDGNLGIGTQNPGSITEWNMATENLELVNAGSAAATEQDWIEVEVGGVTGYIRVFAAK